MLCLKFIIFDALLLLLLSVRGHGVQQQLPGDANDGDERCDIFEELLGQGHADPVHFAEQG